ncbi:hypothetical protein [Helicobacter sp.]|uniref:hypothetical protein n=1 Tax=Helicobacter sp. TaxID=218 RepID=UPI002A74DE85|nr:hypothetical protein [Helicobacter sp.]MDY2585465.1 hypothetical protein [Helicobacter sp.]
MQIADILLRVRARLRDIKFTDLRFSDNELLDYATSAQNDLIFAFNANLQDIEFNLQDSDIFVLPHNVLNIIAIFLNNTQIPLKAYPIALNMDSNIAVFQKSSNVYQCTKKVTGKIKVIANFAAELLGIDSKCVLNTLFADALVYGIMQRALQVETNEANLQRTQFYANAYQQEIQKLRAKLNAQRERKHLMTPYVKV